jgi:hypothetical protein
VERSLCAPLRIRHLAIANLHGGRGPLPGDYVQRTAVITRLRALSTDGELIKTIDDDISIVVNAPSSPRICTGTRSDRRTDEPRLLANSTT